jgi:hypothetical protein
MAARRAILVTAGSVAAAYVIFFACTFELLGDPVRSEAGQWLGPPKRFNAEVTDIGKVFVYHGKQMFVYRFYRPLCVVWLYCMGFS